MICVDSNVAVKWLFEEEFTQEADALRQDTVTASEQIVAPSLLLAEITNTIRQRMRGARQSKDLPLSLAEAKRHLQLFLALPIELAAPSGLHEKALELADAHGLPAVYDAYYLALAQVLDCVLWTADRRLINTLQGRLPFVRWIGDYTSQNPS